MDQKYMLTDTDLEKYKKKNNTETVSNLQLRDDKTTFFQAMLSDDANYIKRGVVAENDIRHAFDGKGES